MSDFPPVGMVAKEDSRLFEMESEDNTVSSKMEGGYEFTRPRNTRRPRRIFKTGFTDISLADADLLLNFFDQKTNAASFTWTDPASSTEYLVRFVGNMKRKYSGIGGNHRFDVMDITLKEV